MISPRSHVSLSKLLFSTYVQKKRFSLVTNLHATSGNAACLRPYGT